MVVEWRLSKPIFKLLGKSIDFSVGLKALQTRIEIQAHHRLGDIVERKSARELQFDYVVEGCDRPL